VERKKESSEANAQEGGKVVRKPLQVLGLMVLLAFGAFVGVAQERKLRTVRGIVVDRDENPAPSSIVYLKNRQTMMVRTYIADKEGRYRFSGLDPNVDYEIHAERGDLTSAKRTISSLDGRQEIVIQLKLDKQKSSQ
jgi:hypothetical protein